MNNQIHSLLVLPLSAFLSSLAIAQASHDKVISVFYFGGTDCSYCNLPQNVANIKRMKKELPKRYAKASMKFVLVVMDRDVAQGIQYARKHGYWDEVSIGQFYNNERMMAHVNKSQNPGLPHIMVYRDSLVQDQYNISTIAQRTLLVDLVGVKALDTWIQDDYPLNKLQ